MAPTISEYQNILLTFFEKNSWFNIELDLGKLGLITGNDCDIDKAGLKIALMEFEKQKLVMRTAPDSVLWFLSKPLDCFTQTLELSYNSTAGIADIVNKYCEINDDSKNLVNPLNIREKDILNVLYLAQQALPKEAGK